MLYFPEKEGDSVSESKLRDLSTDFAVKAIKLTETIHGHRSIVKRRRGNCIPYAAPSEEC